MSGPGDRGGASTTQRRLVESAAGMLNSIVALVMRRYPGADPAVVRAAGAEALIEGARAYGAGDERGFEDVAWRRLYDAARQAATGARPFSAAGRAALDATEELPDPPSPGTADELEIDRGLTDSGHEVAGGYTLGMAMSAIQELGEDGLILIEEDAERKSRLRAAVAALSADERRLAILRLVRRRPAWEVAVILGVSKATVDRRCRALRAKLRRALADQEIEALAMV